MSIDVDRMGDDGWSIRIADASSVTEFAYLRDVDGWDRTKVEAITELLDKATQWVRTDAWDDGYESGTEDEGNRKNEEKDGEIESLKMELADALRDIDRLSRFDVIIRPRSDMGT